MSIFFEKTFERLCSGNYSRENLDFINPLLKDVTRTFYFAAHARKAHPSSYLIGFDVSFLLSSKKLSILEPGKGFERLCKWTEELRNRGTQDDA